jgi:hypothetical protein
MSTEKLTPAEVIATRLMGWKFEKSSKCFGLRSFSKPPKMWQVIEIESGNARLKCSAWPNLDSFDGIRSVEDALWQRSERAFFEYARLLHMNIPANDRGDVAVDALRATCAQRVAAILRVIENMEAANG